MSDEIKTYRDLVKNMVYLRDQKDSDGKKLSESKASIIYAKISDYIFALENDVPMSKVKITRLELENERMKREKQQLANELAACKKHLAMVSEPGAPMEPEVPQEEVKQKPVGIDCIIKKLKELAEQRPMFKNNDFEAFTEVLLGMDEPKFQDGISDSDNEESDEDVIACTNVDNDRDAVEGQNEALIAIPVEVLNENLLKKIDKLREELNDAKQTQKEYSRAILNATSLLVTLLQQSPDL